MISSLSTFLWLITTSSHSFAPSYVRRHGLQVTTRLETTRSPPENAEILSQDPLVYVVRDFLTPQECSAFQERVEKLQQNENRPMTLSNPPEVTINVQKLWPLSIIAVLAGLPPVLRLYARSSETQFGDYLSIAAPNILGTAIGSIVLAYGLVLPVIRRYSKSSSRTSQAMALNLPQDFDLTRPFVDKVEEVTGHSWEKWEAPVVTRYEPGAIFARHGDASPTRGSEWKDQGGQRIVTCICYLNSVSEGGETYFDKLGFGVTPRTGSLLVFFPADTSTWDADDRTTHESLPVREGEKWIVQMFGRALRVPPPLGLPDSYQGIRISESG